MKGYLSFVFFVWLVYQGSSNPIQGRNEPPCEPGDEFFSAGPECFNFYLCREGIVTLFDCPGGSLWNDQTSRCDLAENVICPGAEPPATETPVTTPSPTTPEPTLSPTMGPPIVTHMPDTEGALPILFPESECPLDIRALQIHPTDCRLFYYCLYGVRYLQTCPFLETFNFYVGHCVDETEKLCLGEI